MRLHNIVELRIFHPVRGWRVLYRVPVVSTVVNEDWYVVVTKRPLSSKV